MANTPIGRLQAILTLDSKQFKQGFASAEKIVKRTSKQMQKVGKDLSRFVTVPLVGAGAAITKFGMTFEHEMVKIETLVGVNRNTVERWGDELQKMAGYVGRGPSELARALFVVTSAGERTETALTIVEQAAKASAIGLGDTAEVARAATGAMKAFQSQGLGAAEAVDILTATVREGNLRAEDLAGVIGRVNGMAAALGISFAEVGGAIASYTRLGIKAEEATVGLRAVLSSLTKPTEQSSQALLDIGLSTKELLRMIREEGLAASLNYLIKQFDGNVIAISKVIPNVRALAFLMGTAAANGREFVDVTKSVGDSLGIVDEGFVRVKETAQATFDEMKASLESLAITLSESGGLLDMFKQVTKSVQHFADAFKALAPETQKLVIQVGMISAFLGPLLIGVGLLIPGIFALAGAFLSLGAALLSVWPVLVILLAGLGIANMDGIIKAWDTVTGKIAEFREELDKANNSARMAELGKTNKTLKALGMSNLIKLGILKPPVIVDKKTQEATNQFNKDMEIIGEAIFKFYDELDDLEAVSKLLAGSIDLVDEEMSMLESTIKGLLAKGISPTNDAVQRLTARWNELNDQVKKTEALEKIDELFLSMQKTLRGLKLDSVTADLYEQQQALLEYATAAGLSVEEIGKLMDQMDELAEETASVQVQIDMQKNIEQPFLNAAENIQREWGNMFTELVRNGTSAFEDFGEFLLDLFSRLAGEIITLLIFDPQAISAGGGLGGLLGGLSSMFGGFFGGGGGGYGSYQAGAPYSVPVPPGWNNFSVGLSGLFGISPGTIVDAGQTLSDAIVGIGIGLAMGQAFGFGTGVGSVTNQFNKFGQGIQGQKIGGLVGTIVGSIIGAYFGGPAGAAIGGALGNFILGSSGWGIQNLIESGGKDFFSPQMSPMQQAITGGFMPGFAPMFSGDFSLWERKGMIAIDVLMGGLFSVIGSLTGLFDPGKPTMRLMTVPEVGDTTRFEGGEYRETPFGFIALSALDTSGMGGDKFTRPYLELIDEIDTLLAEYMTDASIALAKEALYTSPQIKEKSRDMDDEIFRAVKDHVSIILNSLSGEAVVPTQWGRYENELLEKMLVEAQTGNDFEELVKMAGQIVIQWYRVEKAIEDTLLATTLGITEAQQATENLNATFDELYASAGELGMSQAKLAEIEAGRAAALVLLTSNFEKSIQESIWNFTDPFRTAMASLVREQEERLRNAEYLGADLVEIERLNALERIELMKQVTQQLSDYAAGLRTPYAVPGEQVDTARQQFFALASRVSAGEYVDPGELIRLASAFEQASRAVYASSPQFFEDLGLIEEVLQAALARYGIIAEDTDFGNVSSIDSARETQTALLTGIDGGIQELMESQAVLITNLTNEVTLMRVTLEEQQAEIMRLARASAA